MSTRRWLNIAYLVLFGSVMALDVVFSGDRRIWLALMFVTLPVSVLVVIISLSIAFWFVGPSEWDWNNHHRFDLGSAWMRPVVAGKSGDRRSKETIRPR